MSTRFPGNNTNNLLATGRHLADLLVNGISAENQAGAAELAAHMIEGCKLDDEIQKTIQLFNNNVENSFKVGGIDGVKPYTTASGFERMHGRFAAWRERKIAELNLVSCQFLAFNILPGGRQMEAYTFEKWVFVYENGESVPTKGSIDGYDFRLEDDGWRIEKVETFAREA